MTAELADVFVPYAALSYVWGNSASHCTYLTNFDRYLNQIDYDIIPQTLRDAIHVTNGLGLRYLWIDAFCIIQDSDDDKVKELVKMGSIYQDAYITISACSAPGGDAGFLQDRTLPPHYRLPFHCRDGRQGSVFVGSRADTVSSIFPRKEPIDRRGWCFQEWLLSPRKLMYTTDTLKYHCHTTARPVEDSLRAIRTVHSSTLDHAFLPLPLAIRANPDLARLSSSELYHRQRMLWGKTVSNYTQRLLTHDTDKLLAFAAVAEQFDRIWQAEWHPGRYVAGLWEKTLPQDLLWYRCREVARNDELRPRPSEYLAPSWAWPSVVGHVLTHVGGAYVHSSEVTCTCEVSECSIVLMDERLPYGRVTDGHLKLRTVCAPAWVIVEPPPRAAHAAESDYGDFFYHELFAPTPELERTSSLPDPHSSDGVEVGILEVDSDSESSEHVVRVKNDLASEGRLLAVGWRRFRAEATLLKRVGQCNIYFDSPERSKVEDSWLVLINRGSHDDGRRVTGEGLLVASMGDARFRRIGCWSVSGDWADGLDSTRWLREDADRVLLTLE